MLKIECRKIYMNNFDIIIVAKNPTINTAINITIFVKVKKLSLLFSIFEELASEVVLFVLLFTA